MFALRYILSVRQLVRQHFRFFLWIARWPRSRCGCFFLFRFPAITNDSFVYGDIAKNWLQHGIYGLSGPTRFLPLTSACRDIPHFWLPCLPFSVWSTTAPSLVVQMFVDIGTCFLIADIARRLVSPRAAKAAFLLAALCPFLASYAAAALTETLEIFFTALAFDCAIAGLETLEKSWSRPMVGMRTRHRRRDSVAAGWRLAAGCD